jgi:hypothetical protein
MEKYICDKYETVEQLPSFEDQIQDRIITFFDQKIPPFIKKNSNNTVCGPLIELLKELSIKFNYRSIL